MAEILGQVDFAIQTRPEIRKGCVWDIGLLFSQCALTHHRLKEIYLEKPRVQRESGAYLCLKVRSKLIQKEIGFGKVGELEHDRPFIEPNPATGSATLKVKFTQRPRGVFHKHADVMVLVISLRSCTSNEVLLAAEHELIFRGGTGSMHSAGSRKKQDTPSIPTPSPNPYHHDHSHTSSRADYSSRTGDHSSRNSSYGDVSNRQNNLSVSHGSSYRNESHPHASSSSSISTRSSAALLQSSTPTLSAPHTTSRPAFTIKPSHYKQVDVSKPDTKSEASPMSYRLDDFDSIPVSSSHMDTQRFLSSPSSIFAHPHLEVQPLTLAAIQEFQLGLQEHCSSTSLQPRFIEPVCSDDFDFEHGLSNSLNALGDGGCINEESMSGIDETKELEAWAQSYGVDTDLISPSTTINQDISLDNPHMNHPFAPLSQLSARLADSSPLLAESSETEFQDASNAYLEREAPFETTDAEAVEELIEVPEDETSESVATPGAMTRARSARIQNQQTHNHHQQSRKRSCPYELEDMPLSKQARTSESSVNPNSVINVSDVFTPLSSTGHSFEDKVFQKLFFRSLPFLNLEELRALAESAPLPIFVKDEQGSYLLANPAFCSFVYDESWDTIINRNASQLLEKDESDKITRADAYIMAREGNIATFYLSVKHQDYKVMKLFTKLREGNQKLVVGAVVTF